MAVATDFDVLDVACPLCEAEPGLSCRRSISGAATTPHRVRTKAAVRVLHQADPPKKPKKRPKKRNPRTGPVYSLRVDIYQYEKVFAFAGRVSRAMSNAGIKDGECEELFQAITSQPNLEQAWRLAGRYVTLQVPDNRMLG